MKVEQIKRKQAMENEKHDVAIKCREMIDAYLAKVRKDERDEREQEIQALIFDEP